MSKKLVLSELQHAVRVGIVCARRCRHLSVYRTVNQENKLFATASVDTAEKR